MIIRGGRVIDPFTQTDRKADVLINDGLIEDVFPLIDDKRNKDGEVVDAAGMVVAPGLVDVHSHFRDPGQTEKEDIGTGERAAIAGGYTTVVLMANTEPAVDRQSILNSILKRVEDSRIHVHQLATVTNGRMGKSLTDMKSLAEDGAPGFSDDGLPIINDVLMRKAMETAAKLKKPISLHEEDPSYISEQGINAGEVAKKFGMTGADRKAEIVMVERDLKLALETGAIINIQHVSAAESVAMIREAKRKDKAGLIHAEATPHHFSLTEKAIIDRGSEAKVNPPLRTERDRQAIIEGLKDGTLDIIATDHAPHMEMEKRRSFVTAPSGMIGLETALALAVTNLVKAGHIDLMKMIELMSLNPAKLYGFKAGTLDIGAVGDVVVFDPNEKWTVSKFYSKSFNSPFIGEELYGKVHYTIAGGKKIVL